MSPLELHPDPGRDPPPSIGAGLSRLPIFDRSAEAIVRLDVQRNHKWRLGTAAETADVLDSLTNGNPGCLDNPKEWEFDESDQMPEWS